MQEFTLRIPNDVAAQVIPGARVFIVRNQTSYHVSVTPCTSSLSESKMKSLILEHSIDLIVRFLFMLEQLKEDDVRTAKLRWEVYVNGVLDLQG